MDVIIISYLTLSTITSFVLFLLMVTDDRKLYMYYYCPKYIYENTGCNVFCTLLIFLIIFTIIPVYYLLWLGYWLCHVGRKVDDHWRIDMTEYGKKYDAMIRASNISKEELIETGQMKGYVGVYNLGLENMYDYLMKNAEVKKHGNWFLLDECSNAGVYCSVCHKKVYKTDYANQKIKSKYCPNCGAIMDLNGE